MRTWKGASVVLVLGLAAIQPAAWGQVMRERDVRVTGPRGNSIERNFRSERGPGFLERDTTIRRPGGTFERDVRIERAPGFAAPLPHGGGRFVPGGWGGGGFRHPPIFERDVVVNSGVPWWGALGIGAGSFGLGMLTGSALSAPPPPPVVYAAPVAVVPAAPPGVVYAAPQPYSPAPPPAATVVVDPVAQAIARLQSSHAPSRRDGCYVLGRLRDPRAIPALVDRLKHDWDKGVRVAAATALGDIGDPQSIVLLERATIYDKRQEVRDAAATSLSRLQQVAANEANANAAAAARTASRAPAGGDGVAPANSIEPLPDAGERVPPPPSPATPAPGFVDPPR